MKMSAGKETAYIGILIALGLVLSYLESLIPLTFAVPGVKIGLANIVVIVALIEMGIKDAFIISVGRIILSGILFGNISMILYSLVGAFLSIVIMFIASKIKIFSITGISILGGVSHNVGQLILASFIMENVNVIYYSPVLIVSGILFGTFIGILAGSVINNIVKKT